MTNKSKIREALRTFDRLVAQVKPVDLAMKFGALRTQIVNINSNADWRDWVCFCADIARDYQELSEMLGVSVKSVQLELRRRGVPPLKPGRKGAAKKYPFRNCVPEYKPYKS